MDYLQVSLTVARQSSENLSSLLELAGALSVTVESANDEEIFDVAQPGDPSWQSQRLTALFSQGFNTDALSSALRAHPQAEDISVSALPDQDWERNWLEQFHPVEVGERLWVCPSWLSPPDPQATNLIIDPGLAFGTGTHQTTHLCLSWLARQQLNNHQLVVDFGCGSGILAIAALKLGASEAVAIDIDPKAVDASVNNARTNGVQDQLHAGLPEDIRRLLDGRQSTLVIANILADTLIELKQVLMDICAPGATLLLSGVLDSQTDRVMKAFADRFHFERIQKGDWMLLVGRAVQSH